MGETLEARLVAYTMRNSRHDADRRYIGLSAVADCALALYRSYFAVPGARPGQAKLLLFYQGYQAEDDVVRRLRAIGDYRPPLEISLWDGIVKGHTDGSFEGDLVEIKSVPMEADLPSGKLPRRVYWQVQGYLHFTKYTRCQVIYLARGTGSLRVITVREDMDVGRRIERKLLDLVRRVDERNPPGCECGRCLANV